MVKTRSQATMADSGNAELLALLAEMKKSMEDGREEMRIGQEEMKKRMEKGLQRFAEDRLSTIDKQIDAILKEKDHGLRKSNSLSLNSTEVCNIPLFSNKNLDIINTVELKQKVIGTGLKTEMKMREISFKAYLQTNLFKPISKGKQAPTQLRKRLKKQHY
ncbi:hypothetical protein NPIL_546521 [Nephila pilipes]|uniref:Uncharacterized protein n=1 Tax=Nephila pilipes TaxID=299642 RepID=A0A8X6ICN4_NEPPI|nr:hypothetical protein NPIL_546521 [Nephila pilipes]